MPDWQGGSDTRWRRFRAWVLERDGYLCRVQLEGCTVRAPLVGGHVDHVIPLHQGGAKYDPANVRASCRSCNLKRGRARERFDPEPDPISSWDVDHGE